MNVRVCKTTTGLVPLSAARGLHLRPEARFEIRVPIEKNGTAALSSWEACERIREVARPDALAELKVVETGAEGLRLVGEIEERERLRPLIKRLDGAAVRLKGRTGALRLSAAEAPSEFPSRHDWDSFFRDAPDMDEMKAGERPDTVRLEGLPTEWFAEPDAPDLPSERIVSETLSKFGKLRRIDVPVLDPHRAQMKESIAGISKFSFDSGLRFDAYVQYSEYSSFARAMDALRGTRLVRKCPDGLVRSAAVKITFDKTKHLSDAAVKRRSIVRERLAARQRNKEAKEKEEKEAARKKKDNERRRKELTSKERLRHTEEREKRRKERQLAKLKAKEAKEIDAKIEREKRKLLKTQRKLQTIRLLEELFRRLDVKNKNGELKKRKIMYDEVNSKRDKGKKEMKQLQKALMSERSGRDRLVSKYKNAQEQELQEQRLKLQNVLDGTDVLRSVLETDRQNNRSSSMSSLSSASDVPNIKTERINPSDRKNGADVGYSAPGYPYPYAGYPSIEASFYPRGGYDGGYSGRGRGYSQRRTRGGAYPTRGYRNMPRLPYYDGSETSRLYYRYFKSLTDDGNRDNNRRERSRSRSRSRRRNYKSRSSSRSKSRSRRRSLSRRRSRYSRSYSRSQSRSSHSKSRSRTRRCRSGSNRSKSVRRSRSKSVRSKRGHRSRSHSKRSHRSRSKSAGSKNGRRSRAKSIESHRSKTKTREGRRSRTESKEKRRLRSHSKTRKKKSGSKSKSRSRSRSGRDSSSYSHKSRDKEKQKGSLTPKTDNDSNIK